MNLNALLAISIPAFLGIVSLLVLHVYKQRLAPVTSVQESAHWSLRRLLLSSWLTLFAELAIIRWIAVEVRIFSYFKNMALLLCFLGFGFGCAIAKSRRRWVSAAVSLLAILTIVRGPLRSHAGIDLLSQRLGASADAHVWHTQATNLTDFLLAALVCGGLMLLITTVFVPLGQEVSRQFDAARRPLDAYSWNLAGSLLGILTFFIVCRLMWPPTLWLPVVFIGFGMLQVSRAEQWLLAAMALPAALLLYEPATTYHFAFWTPYQQIEYQRTHIDGISEPAGGSILVNHDGYQWIVNLAPDFVSRHPSLLKERIEDNPYNLPFRFAMPHPSVMIVGAGSGNDTAAALRNGSLAVDAVEIDPAILNLGRREHPEHPYDSPQVAVYVEDARAFLKRTRVHYDLILFGLLDSHTQLSDYSNMRIDNFVYTEEAIGEAKAHLNRNGILFVKFQVDLPWVGKRIYELLTQTFGKPPLVFHAGSSYTALATCFVISPSSRVEEALAADSRLALLAGQQPQFVHSRAVPITTDDWPYLYQKDRRIPRIFYSVGFLVILLALGMYGQIPHVRTHRPSLFFFVMGAGFLLMETLVISRLALYFGTTWQVNGFVIAALLCTLLVSNLIVERWGDRLRSKWVIMGLLASLAFAYTAPFNRIQGAATLAGACAALVFSVPVFCAGLLFATQFRRTASPSTALGSNVLGAVLGGLLENLSFVTGMRALLLVVVVLYLVAAVALRRLPRRLESAIGASASEA